MTKKKEQKKQQKPKLQIKAIIDKNLARALSLTVAGKMINYTISAVYFNAKEKELVATDGKVLLVVKIKPAGLLSITLNLEEGLYNVIGNMLIKNDIEQNEIKFPSYQKIIPVKPKKICNGDILHGLLDCIVKNQIHLDIWKFAPVLKTLDRVSHFWEFFNNSSIEPIVMEFENNDYFIRCVMMPCPTPFTNMSE